MDKIMIFGNGQMGNLYLNYFKSKKYEVKISKTDITNKNGIQKAIDEFEPTVVINTAAKTNLEWVSDNKLEAFKVNVLGADNVAQVCDDKNIFFVHLSSGCIFESKDENDIKTEDSEPNPASYYAWTKVWAEQMIQFEKSKDFQFLILRPRQPISSEVNYKNMLVKFLTFTKFIETPNTGTVLEDLLGWTETLILKRSRGLVHVANEGWTTPLHIAELLKKYVLAELPIEKISKEELDKMTPNKRVDTVLSVDKLKSIVGSVETYENRLEDTIKSLARNFQDLDKAYIKDQLDKTMEQSKARTVVNKVWQNLIK